MYLRIGSTAVAPKPGKSSAKTKDYDLVEEHLLRLDKILRDDESYGPVSEKIAKFSYEFSKLPDRLKHHVLGGSKQIIPAIKGGLMRSDAVEGFKTLLKELPVTYQNGIIWGLWAANGEEHTSDVCKGLVQLLPPGEQDAMLSHLGEPVPTTSFASHQSDKGSSSSSSSSSTSSTSSSSSSSSTPAGRLQRFDFYQTPEVDQTLIKEDSILLDEMLATGNASAIRLYQKNFQNLAPAEKRIVLAECPELINAILSEDTDALKAYQELLRTLNPVDQAAIINRIWQNCISKNIVLCRGLADLLPAAEKQQMLGNLHQLAEQQKKHSTDRALTLTRSHRSIDPVSVGIQLRKAMEAMNAHAIKQIAQDFEKLPEGDQVHILKNCSTQIGALLESREEGYFSTRQTKEAADVCKTYKDLCGLIKSPLCRDDVAIDLVVSYYVYKGPHQRSTDIQNDIARLMTDRVGIIVKDMLGSAAQGGYTRLFSKPELVSFYWLLAIATGVRDKKYEEVQLYEKLLELIPPHYRANVLMELFVNSETYIRNGRGSVSLLIRTFARLLKFVPPALRGTPGKFFSHGLLNAFKNNNVDALHAYRDLIEAAPRQFRHEMRRSLLDSEQLEFIKLFPLANLKNQQALLKIVLGTFNGSATEAVNLYLNLISTITDPEKRRAMLEPKNKALQNSLKEAIESLDVDARISFQGRLSQTV